MKFILPILSMIIFITSCQLTGSDKNQNQDGAPFTTSTQNNSAPPEDIQAMRDAGVCENFILMISDDSVVAEIASLTAFECLGGYVQVLPPLAEGDMEGFSQGILPPTYGPAETAIIDGCFCAGVGQFIEPLKNLASGEGGGGKSGSSYNANQSGPGSSFNSGGSSPGSHFNSGSSSPGSN